MCKANLLILNEIAHRLNLMTTHLLTNEKIHPGLNGDAYSFIIISAFYFSFDHYDIMAPDSKGRGKSVCCTRFL